MEAYFYIQGNKKSSKDFFFNYSEFQILLKN